MGQLLGTDASVPVAREVRAAPDHRAVQAADGVSAGAVGRRPSTGGANGRTAQNLVETSREQLGGDRHQAADDVGQVARELDKGDKAGPGLARGRGVGAGDRRAGARAGRRGRRPKPDEPAKPETRIVVFGDSDFVSQRLARDSRATSDLFLNAVNWLAQQENLISIRPRDPEDRRVTLTADQQRRDLLAVDSDHPGADPRAGVQTWWRRR